MNDPSSTSDVVQAIASLQEKLAAAIDGSATRTPSKAAMKSNSDAVKSSWVRDGLLASGATLAARWSSTESALADACASRELFAVPVEGGAWYPAAFLDCAQTQVAEVTQAFGDADEASMAIFWFRKHGGLAARTPVEALCQGATSARVAQLASAMADENGWTGLARAPMQTSTSGARKLLRSNDLRSAMRHNHPLIPRQKRRGIEWPWPSANVAAVDGERQAAPYPTRRYIRSGATYPVISK